MPRKIEPAHIWSLPDNKKNNFKQYADSGEYFAQEKIDGCLYIFEKDEKGDCYLFSRTKSAKDGELVEKGANVPHIIEGLSFLPKDTVILGEIAYPNGTSKDVTPIMGCLPELAIKRQNEDYGKINYYIYDILVYDGVNLISARADIRYKILENIIKNNNLPDFLFLIPTVWDNIYEYTESILNRGGEGAVLKKKNAPYSPGKRPAWDTIKRKKAGDEDVVCIGFCEPTKYYDGKLNILINYDGTDADQWPYWVIEEMELSTGKILSEEKVPVGVKKNVKGINWRTVPVTKGYYKNWYTSIEIGAFNENNELVKIGTVSSGLTDEIKQDISENSKNYLNKVVKVGYMEKDINERTLRHPYLIEFRDDKQNNECLISDIFH